MWEFEHTIETEAEAAAIWALWSDVSTWPQSDEGIAWVRLDGPFTPGTSGELCPKGAEPMPFKIIEATPGSGFTDETELPGASLRFAHRLTAGARGTTMTYRVTLDGPAAAEYAGFGAELATGVPETMAKLAALALARSQAA
jgi:hypothetical protein